MHTKDHVLTENVPIGNAEDLDVVMPTYNLIEQSKNYRPTTGSLVNYYRDEPSSSLAANYNADPITISNSFKQKSSIAEKTSNVNQEDGEYKKVQRLRKILKLLFH